MPELTERKLLCRMCGKTVLENRHNPDAVEDYAHPFDGVPYVPCPECAKYGGDGWIRPPLVRGFWRCPSCASSPVPGWVREEA